MRAFSTVTGVAIPLGLRNVDTDVILPAKHLKVIERTGLGRFAFATLRQHEPDNPFDSPRNRGAPILIAGANFGCGSSREHAPWAIADMGICAVIAPSFADIFAGNAFKNGILLVELPQTQIDRLLAIAAQAEITVSLVDQRVTTSQGDAFPFTYDAFRKDCLLNGLDEIAITERDMTVIKRFAAHRLSVHPWIASGTVEA